jgi:glycosyltransferase involved in cell wall biosynthesis
MRIGLNLLHVLPEITGAWGYLGGLLNALARHGGDTRFVAFVTPASEALVPADVRFQVVRVPLRSSVRPLRVLFENTVLAGLARSRGIDTMHHFAGTLPLGAAVPSVVTIYDLLVFADPAPFRPLSRAYLRTMVPRAARRANMLTPISHTTARDVVARLGVAPERIRVVPPVIAEQFRPRPADEVEAFRRRHSLPGEFWLYVANAYPHKNYARLFAACARLHAQGRCGWPLVVRADPSPELARLIGQAGIADRVVLLPALDDAEMPLLYGAASAFVFPSLFEGAGLPLMEALACGCPAVASDIPTTREFAGDAAPRFDPLDVESIAGCMAALCASVAAGARAPRSATLSRPDGCRAAGAAAAFLDAHATAAAGGNGPG